QSYSSPRGARLGRPAPAGQGQLVEARGPARRSASATEPVAAPPAEAEATAELLSSLNIADDDRDNILPGEKVLLVVENDLGFARMLLQAARRAGFKGLVSASGAGALALA